MEAATGGGRFGGCSPILKSFSSPRSSAPAFVTGMCSHWRSIQLSMTKPPTTRPGSATFFQTPQRIAAPRRLEAPDPGGELGDHIFWQAQTAYDSASKDSASKDSAIYIYVAVAPVHAKLCRAKGNGKFRKSTLGAFEVHSRLAELLSRRDFSSITCEMPWAVRRPLKRQQWGGNQQGFSWKVSTESIHRRESFPPRGDGVPVSALSSVFLAVAAISPSPRHNAGHPAAA